MSRNRQIALALAGAALLGLPATGAGAAATKQVVLKDIDFKPGNVVVRRGDRVRWVWQDPRTPHNVVSRGRLRFRSSATKETGTHVVRFRKRGTYRYVCTIHPGMAGKVTVR
jgi:plastocyanin